METIRYLQRLHKPVVMKHFMDNPFSFGGGLVNGGLSKEAMNILRSICSFDYTGSAEFEFGAVPAAFNKLGASANEDKLGFYSIYFKEKGEINTVYFICNFSDKTEVEKVISVLYHTPSKLNLKEYCGLREYFFGNSWNLDII